ncbi:hypothetical protein CTA1_11497 [Colletotrichum tanaceti]|uniref:Uncharacterized protein n=1 Tax=Colletotrichum tanaceti TaxID=1306861 RepID=A0A4U6XU25_9PEZI|nr:hypothetical protein CTA1_11497 [Colletotrichum tanaceti]
MNGIACSRQQESEPNILGGGGSGGSSSGSDVNVSGIKGSGIAGSEFASVQEIDRKMDSLLQAHKDALQTALHHELEIKRLY